MNRPKLTIDEQILDMQNKGITFDRTSIEEAKKFLRDSNYYFKLKAYGRNYDKYSATLRKDQYINLDFAYLRELSTIDMYLRKLIISMALDIEHALKVQLLYDLSENTDEDGYSIVKEYLNTNYLRVKSLHDKIGRSVTSDLVKKHAVNEDRYALWELVEILSFGEFVDIYQLYYSKYKRKDDYSSFLWSVKFLRNAAAHNNCIINSLKAPYQVSLHKNKDILFQVSKIKSISKKSRDTWMQNPVIHDFVVTVYVYLNVVKSEGIKQKGIQNLKELFYDRMLRHKDYFEKNNSIREGYLFTEKCVSTFCNRYRK
ncbi:MAG: Abi family protein [Eubacterium sp.]|nr:Abi family protein [Eubacterium sp.]